MRTLLASVLVTAVLIASAVAVADYKDEARAHFEAGMKLVEKEDFVRAAEEFEQSLALYSTKNGLFNLANCYRQLHRYAEALEVIERMKLLHGKDLDERMAAAVGRQEQELLGLVAVLYVEVDTHGATVSVNGNTVGRTPLAAPMRLNPGPAVIEVELGGYLTEKRELRLEGGATRKELISMRSELGNVVVTTNVAAQVYLDGSAVGEPPRARPFVLKPGRHVLVAKSPGYLAVERVFEVSSGEALKIDISLSPVIVKAEPSEAEPAAPGSEEKRVWTWVSFGVAGGAAAVGAITGIAASLRTRDLKMRCPDDTCSEEDWDLYRQAERLAAVTNAMIAVTVIGAAAGTTLYFLEPRLYKGERDVSVAPAVSPDGGAVMLEWSF
jgi:hypothetical protein